MLNTAKLHFQNTRAIIREPIPGRPVTWTGPGFMRVNEGDSLTFKMINDIPVSMEYDIVIRYEPQVRLPSCELSRATICSDKNV